MLVPLRRAMVGEVFQNSTKNIYLFNFNRVHSYLTEIFIQIQQLYLHSRKIFIQLHQSTVVSHSRKIFVQLQE